MTMRLHIPQAFSIGDQPYRPEDCYDHEGNLTGLVIHDDAVGGVLCRLGLAIDLDGTIPPCPLNRARAASGVLRIRGMAIGGLIGALFWASMYLIFT